jgi:hypothetical protein
VSAGADGTAEAEEVGVDDESEGGGAPYCAATKAGRARRAREVVKIMMGDEEIARQTWVHI